MQEPFLVADSSPLIQYGDGQTSSWTAGYARQADGFDRTLHLTTQRDAVSFYTTATSLTLLVQSFADCAATVSINSSSPIPACTAGSSADDTPFSLYNLPVGLHHVEWDSGEVPAGEQVIFWGFEGTRPGDASGMTNVTIDDTYKGGGGVQYAWHGDWATTAGTDANELDFNRTLALTSRQGASVTFQGAGSAVYLYGSVGPDHGSASIALNDEIVAPRMNLTSPWLLSSQLLWFETGLDPASPLTVVMTNLEEKRMTLDFVILTTDQEVLVAISSTGKSQSFASTLAGKLVLFLVIPLVACAGIGAMICLHCRRRQRRLRIDSLHEHYVAHPDSEKRGSGGVWSGRSGTPSIVDEVFVSYDEGRNQRLSDRWRPSPTSSSTSPSSAWRSHTGSHSQPILAALPEGQSILATPLTEDSTGGSWSRPLRSLLGSSYTGSSVPQSKRRETSLPPYTPGMNGSYLADVATGSSAALPSVSEEKAAQLAYALRAGSTAPALAGPSGVPRPASTVADSEVMSVFGAPPSERRESSMTQWSNVPLPPAPSIPPFRPTVITDLAGRYASSPASAVSSATPGANSAMPLLADFPETKRARSTGALSVVSGQSGQTEDSAARPDSDIIPFEAFFASKVS